MNSSPFEAKTSALDELDWVRVGNLFVARHVVTVAQFRKFVDSKGYSERAFWSERGWEWKVRKNITAPAYWMVTGFEDDALPVTGVSFWEAEAFASFTNSSILTEKEWYLLASNQGTTLYPWGDDVDDIPSQRANLSFFGAFRSVGLMPVTAFPEGQSHTGIFGLIGNVSEWCFPGASQSIAENQSHGVLRGGCSWHTPDVVDATFRDEVNLEVRDNQTGIRLIRREGKQADSEVSLGAPVTRSPPLARRPIQRPTRPFRQEGIPVFEQEEWVLNVGGEVHAPLSLSLEELKSSFRRTTRRGVFVCVCRWAEVNDVAGVLLSDIIQKVGPRAPIEGLYLRQFSQAGPNGQVYDAAIRLKDALGEDAILAYELDGSPLSLELGAPLRLFSWSFYGYKLVKCLSRLEITSEFRPGWWETTNNYCTEGVVRPGTVTLIGDNPQRMTIAASGAVALANLEP
jgi:iron(II)-dependent oxidoreductase